MYHFSPRLQRGVSVRWQRWWRSASQVLYQLFRLKIFILLNKWKKDDREWGSFLLFPLWINLFEGLTSSGDILLILALVWLDENKYHHRNPFCSFIFVNTYHDWSRYGLTRSRAFLLSLFLSSETEVWPKKSQLKVTWVPELVRWKAEFRKSVIEAKIKVSNHFRANLQKQPGL